MHNVYVGVYMRIKEKKRVGERKRDCVYICQCTYVDLLFLCIHVSMNVYVPACDERSAAGKALCGMWAGRQNASGWDKLDRIWYWWWCCSFFSELSFINISNDSSCSGDKNLSLLKKSRCGNSASCNDSNFVGGDGSGTDDGVAGGVNGVLVVLALTLVVVLLQNKW